MRARRLAATALTAGTCALGLAAPALADDIVAPTPPDTSVAAAAIATAAQTASANVNLSVRIGSPGDAGAVTQSIASTVEAAAQQAAAPAEAAPADAAAVAAAATTTQPAPANVEVSVRIASPGNDGATTQTIVAAAETQAQYQPGPERYQPTPQAADPEEPKAAPQSSPTAPAPTVEPTAPPRAVTPTNWNWTWTWRCGDITAPGTTKTIDTGVEGWVWNWNLPNACAPVPVTPVNTVSVIPPKSPEVISPLPPDPPAVPEPIPPTPPPIPSPPEAAAVLAPLLDVVELAAPPSVEADPSDRIAAIASGALLGVGAAPVQPVVLKVALPRVVTSSPSFEQAATEPGRVEPAGPQHSRDDAGAPRPAEKRVPVELAVSSGVSMPATGGGGSSGGGGATAALALWLLLQVPGLAVLRLPRSLRSPRSRVDAPETRPG